MRIQKPADAARVLRTRRIALGLTQQEVAEAVGITRQSLARIEKGNGGGAFDTYLRLFELLSISLEANQHPTEATNNTNERQQSPTPQRQTRWGALVSPELSHTAQGLVSSLVSKPSFDEFRKQIASLQRSFAVNKINLSGTGVGLAHLKSVIDSSEQDLEAATPVIDEQNEASNEGSAQ